jgi:MFS family permease
MAHVDLAKAELSAIGGEIAKLLGLFAGAVALVLLALTLVVIGTTLFTAEWLLGSMGWGVLHGLFLFVGIAIALVLFALGIGADRLARSFAIALLIGVLTSIALALNLPNQLYTLIGDRVLTGVEAGVRPLVVGLALGAIVGLVIGILVASRVTSTSSRGSAIVGIAVLGAAIGAFLAITFGPQVGIGIGMTVGYVAWSVLMAVDVQRTGIDTEALQARFVPTRTIETSKETLEWLQSKMPPGTRS